MPGSPVDSDNWTCLSCTVMAGEQLPSQAIQRVLYITPRVHVYQIPPLTSNKGYTAATWTNRPPIFTARLRIMETSTPAARSEKVSTAILLEDGSSGELFAAAPFNHPAVVTQAVDSSRFFAIRVVGDDNRKATLGFGFEERSEAFDFNVTLQDSCKTLGFAESGNMRGTGVSTSGQNPGESAKPQDYSLKEGQTITINIAGRGAKTGSRQSPASTGQMENATPFLPPPPNAAKVKSELHNEMPPAASDAATKPGASAKDFGFDDGEFGEFQ